MSPISNERLSFFVRSSFALSSGVGAPSEAQVSAHRGLMMCDRLSARNVLVLASYLDGTARLRAADYPDGGMMEAALEQLLSLANARVVSADELASLFRFLKPLTAANRRCARALWLWRLARGSEADRRFLLSCSPGEAWGEADQGSASRRVA